jgi:8-oxo-dGTP diphosphatase
VSEAPVRRLVFARTLCFVLSGGDVLMLKGAPTKRLYPNLYNGVGGHVEAGEDVLTSLRREVREETGLEITGERLAAVLNAEEEGKPGVVVFVMTALATGRRVISSREGEVAWVPRADLLALDLVPDLPRLLPVVLTSEGEGIWYGHSRFDSNGALVEFGGVRGTVAP